MFLTAFEILLIGIYSAGVGQFSASTVARAAPDIEIPQSWAILAGLFWPILLIVGLFMTLDDQEDRK